MRLKANVRKQDFAVSTLGRAIGTPFLFAFLFLAAYPSTENQPPYDHQSVVPAVIVLTLAIGGWFFVLWSVLRVLHAGIRFGSGWAAVSVLPLLAYACGLVAAWWALQQH